MASKGEAEAKVNQSTGDRKATQENPRTTQNDVGRSGDPAQIAQPGPARLRRAPWRPAKVSQTVQWERSQAHAAVQPSPGQPEAPGMRKSVQRAATQPVMRCKQRCSAVVQGSRPAAQFLVFFFRYPFSRFFLAGTSAMLLPMPSSRRCNGTLEW